MTSGPASHRLKQRANPTRSTWNIDAKEAMLIFMIDWNDRDTLPEGKIQEASMLS
jgi:hypothetical protein